MIRPYFVAREMYDDGIGTDDDDEDHDKDDDDDDDDHGDDDDIDQVLGKRKQTKKSFQVASRESSQNRLTLS